MSEKKASPNSGTTTSSSSSTPTLTSSPIPQQPAPPPQPQPSQVPQVQVIQPLHSSPYLQHLYNTPPPQLMLHGNLAIQPGAMAQLQGITHNLSLQLTHNKASPKSPTLISTNNSNTKSPNLTNAVVTSKASGIGPIQAAQMIATATSGKNVIHGQPLTARVPATTHQPLVINQLITTAPSLLTTQLDSHIQNEAQAKQRYDVWNLQLDSHLQTEAQAKQRYDVWNLQPAKHDHNKPLGQQTLQPKSAMMPAHVQPTSQAQVISGAQFVHSKQMSSQPQLVACQPQIITSQPAMLTSQAQVINHFQNRCAVTTPSTPMEPPVFHYMAMAALPQNISWAHASLQSPATLLTTQTPIFIRSQQQDVFIQSQPTFQTQATAAAQPLPNKVKQAVELPTKLVTKQSVGTGTKSVPAILPLHPNQVKTPTTQTWTSVTPSVASKPASKPRAKNQTNRSVQVTSGHPKSSHQAKVFPATIATSTTPTSSVTIAKVPPEVKSSPPPKEPEMPVLEMAPTAAIIAAASQINHIKEDSPPPKELPCTNGILENNPCENPSSFVDREPKKLEENGHETEVKVEKPQPQKAIVKPQILTHVIEGYVIQEGPEPFPFEKVNRSSLLTEFIPPKMTQAEKDLEEGKEHQGQERSMFLEHKFSKSVSVIPLDMAKCEFCGKMDVKARFKRSKRFCTTSCAKRYNVGCSKRLGLFTPAEPSKYALKKKKRTIKIRRTWKKVPRPPFLPDDKSLSPDMKEDEEEEESSSTPESQEDCPMSAEPPTLQPMECETMEVDRPEPEKVPPAKWTVNDVSEFIRALPGCKDYAEEFRIQEIDGQALMLLKEDHLMSAMNMKLGPALKICARINSLKEDSM